MILCIGCSSAAKKPEAVPSYEARLDALLAKRPDDPDLLFLRQDHKDLRRVAKLGSLRPTPVVLATVASQYLAHGLDEESIPAFRNLLQTWIECDPNNSMPLVLRGLLETSCGDLRRGLETLVAASKLPSLRTYSLEGMQEGLRLQKQEGLADVEYFGVFVLRDFHLTMVMTRACGLLVTVSIEYLFRRNQAEALRFAEAEYRLAVSFSASASTFLEASNSFEAASYAAGRLCELYLMEGKADLATRCALQSHRSQVAQEVLKLAIKRDLFESPIHKTMIEVGLMKESEGVSKGNTEKDVWDALSPLFGASRATWDRFWAKLRENEVPVRAYLEAQIRRGQVAVAMEAISDTDRRPIESRKFPIDRFMEAKEIFYPVRYGPESRDQLIAYLKTGDQNEDSETREFFQAGAARSLVHHGDKDALPMLRSLLDKPSSDWILVTIVGLGDRSDRVVKILEESFGEYREGNSWALAQLGRIRFVPDLLQDLVLNVRPGQVTHGFQEAVTAYFALRDLTGQDFELHRERWSDWAERTGIKKE